MDTGDFTRESSANPLAKSRLWPVVHRASMPPVRRPTVGGDHTVRIHHAMGGAHALLDVDSATGEALRLSLRIDLIEVCLKARPGHDAEDLFFRAALAVARGSHGLPDHVTRRYFRCASELERRCRRSLAAAGPAAGTALACSMRLAAPLRADWEAEHPSRIGPREAARERLTHIVVWVGVVEVRWWPERSSARLGWLYLCALLGCGHGCAASRPTETASMPGASTAADARDAQDAGIADAAARATLGRSMRVETDAICPLLGLGYHNPAALQPELRIVGTDMGVPVELGDELYLVFGDTWTDLDVCGPVEEPYRTLDSDDVLGRVAMSPPPDPEACLDILFPELPDDPSKFPPLQLQHGGEPVGLLEISVATAAFAHDDRLYAFFNPFGDVTCESDADCGAPARCGGGVCTYGGMPTLPPRILAVAEAGPDGRPGPHFVGLSELTSPRFTSLGALTVDGLDTPTRKAPSELLVFGRPHYLTGLSPATDRTPWGLYLLHQPLAELASDGRLQPRYFAGLDAEGEPRWSEDPQHAASIVDPETERVPDGQGAIWFMGTMSVSSIPAFGPEGYRWLLTYGGRPPSRVDAYALADQPEVGIYYRLARNPWGPWTDPALLYSAHEAGGYGELLYRPDSPGVVSDDNRAPRQCDESEEPYYDHGVEYAPQVLSSFTRLDGETLTVYWLLSTWNPYRVVQMRSELTLAP